MTGRELTHVAGHALPALFAPNHDAAILQCRPMWSVEAENLFLRRQLGLFKERGIKPRRVDAANAGRKSYQLRRSARLILAGRP